VRGFILYQREDSKGGRERHQRITRDDAHAADARSGDRRRRCIARVDGKAISQEAKLLYAIAMKGGSRC